MNLRFKKIKHKIILMNVTWNMQKCLKFRLNWNIMLKRTLIRIISRPLSLSSTIQWIHVIHPRQGWTWGRGLRCKCTGPPKHPLPGVPPSPYRPCPISRSYIEYIVNFSTNDFLEIFVFNPRTLNFKKNSSIGIHIKKI